MTNVSENLKFRKEFVTMSNIMPFKPNAKGCDSSLDMCLTLMKMDVL